LHPPSHTTYFSLLLPPPPSSTLFPYTTLFRSNVASGNGIASTRATRKWMSEPAFAAFLLATSIISGEASMPCTSPGPTLDLRARDRKSTRLNSSHDQISYAVFCLKKKNKIYVT